MYRWVIGLAVAWSFGASPARATYSIVAVDRATRQVGGAGASCVGSSGVARIYGSAPGVGVVLAQASSSPALRDEAVRRLLSGESPMVLLTGLTDPSLDRDAAARQYGVVTLDEGAAGYTGSLALAFADDRQGALGDLVYSVQGNILTGESVLERSRQAFEAGGCDLPERLMRGLEAAAALGEGDRRCTLSGVPADAAFIQVDRPDEAAGSYLFLEVRDTGAEDSVALLRTRFDGWRATHPCPESPDEGLSVDAGPGDARSGGCTASGASGAAATFGTLLVLVWMRRRS